VTVLGATSVVRPTISPTPATAVTAEASGTSHRSGKRPARGRKCNPTPAHIHTAVQSVSPAAARITEPTASTANSAATIVL